MQTLYPVSKECDEVGLRSCNAWACTCERPWPGLCVWDTGVAVYPGVGVCWWRCCCAPPTETNQEAAEAALSLWSLSLQYLDCCKSSPNPCESLVLGCSCTPVSMRLRVITGPGAACPLPRTSSWYFLELTNELYVFSLLNLFLVRGSVHIFCTRELAFVLSWSFRASNQSRVTGGKPATFLLRLYLCKPREQKSQASSDRQGEAA